MRSRGRDEVHITGSARARTGGSGRVVRTSKLLNRPVSLVWNTIQTGTGIGTGTALAGGAFHAGVFFRWINRTNYNLSTDGISWVSKTAPAQFHYEKGAGSDTTGTIIYSAQTASTTPFYRSTDGGNTFTNTSGTVPSNVYTIGWARGVWFALPFSASNQPYASYDDGLTWSAIGAMSFTPSFQWWDLKDINGLLIASPAYDVNFSVSRDMGATWFSVPTYGNTSSGQPTASNKWTGVYNPNNNGTFGISNGLSGIYLESGTNSGTSLLVLDDLAIYSGNRAYVYQHNRVISHDGTSFFPWVYGNGLFVEFRGFNECRYTTGYSFTYEETTE